MYANLSSSALTIRTIADPTFDTITLNDATFTANAFTYTLPNVTDTLVTLTSFQTITSKTFTENAIKECSIDYSEIGSFASDNGTFASITIGSGLAGTEPVTGIFIPQIAVNTVVVTDASSMLIGNSTYTGYLSNLTSDPQTQINNIVNGTTTFTGLTANSIVTTNGSSALSTNSTYATYLANLTSDPQTQINNIINGTSTFTGLTVTGPLTNTYLENTENCVITANTTGTLILNTITGSSGISVSNEPGNIIISGTAAPLPITITPVYVVGDHYNSVPFPYSYTASNAVVLFQCTLTFPSTGTYRVQAEWNLSIYNTSGSIQPYSAFVTDSATPLNNIGGGIQFARQATEIPATLTQQMGCTGTSFYSTYSNQTVTFSLVFSSYGNCTLNANNNQYVTPATTFPNPVVFMACYAV